MSNILMLISVAEFIQTGEHKDLFMQLPKKARRKADGVRNAALFGRMALVWEQNEEDRAACCPITGLAGKCNLFSLQPLQLAGPKAEPVELPAADKVPEHDFIDLKLIKFVSAEEAENYGSSDDSEYVLHCNDGFDVNIFRAETGLYNGALSYKQMQNIKAQILNCKDTYAVIQYSIITVFN